MNFEQVDENEFAELYVVGKQDWRRTGCMRLDFVRGCVSATKGFVINLGCADDPAGLKADFGPRVCNVDFTSVNGFFPDIFMDVTRPWDQFADNSAEMVVMGDLLHVPTVRPDAEHVLREARRVAVKLCLTVPIEHSEGVLSEAGLRLILQVTGWRPYLFATTGWGFPDVTGREVEGFCVEVGRV